MNDRSKGVYIGRMPNCGCVMALTTDNRGKETAEAVADFIKDGLIVTHITFDEYRNTIVNEPGFMDCQHVTRQMSLIGEDDTSWEGAE